MGARRARKKQDAPSLAQRIYDRIFFAIRQVNWGKMSQILHFVKRKGKLFMEDSILRFPQDVL